MRYVGLKFALGIVWLVLLRPPIEVIAAPQTISLGSQQATLQLQPDPVQVGPVQGVLTLTGASPQELAQTSASFSTLMPSMSMAGPSGDLRSVGAGRYEFHAVLGMAAGWDIAFNVRGPVHGTVTYHVQVAPAILPTTVASHPLDPAVQANNPTQPAGMLTLGDPGAWRIAGWTAAILLIVAAIVLLRARREQRLQVLIVTFGAFVTVIVLAGLQAKYAAPAMDMAAMSAIQGDAPVPVTLGQMRFDRHSATISAAGSTAPFITQDIVTRAAGVLRDFNWYAGDHVHAGTILATLDAPELHHQAQAAQAQANEAAAAEGAAAIAAQHHAPDAVILAQTDTQALKNDLLAAQSDAGAKLEQRRYWNSELQRETTLLAQGAVARSEFEDERAQASAARAAFDVAIQRVASLRQQLLAAQVKETDAAASLEQMQLQAQAAHAQTMRADESAKSEAVLASYTFVTSPNDAIVLKRFVDPGVYVAAGTAILRLVDLHRLRIQAAVAPNDMPGITLGTLIDVRSSDGLLFHGAVSSISPLADPQTRTITVEAIVDNPELRLIPGGFVRVTLHPQRSAVGTNMVVPSSAIIGEGTTTALWIDRDDRAHRIPVQVLGDDGKVATITGRIDDRMRIVIEGASTLEEGQAITEHPQ